jgi:hypothetical protein
VIGRGFEVLETRLLLSVDPNTLLGLASGSTANALGSPSASDGSTPQVDMASSAPPQELSSTLSTPASPAAQDWSPSPGPTAPVSDPGVTIEPGASPAPTEPVTTVISATGANETFPTAQPLPATDNSLVLGQLRASDTINLYRIALAPGSPGLRVTLSYTDTTGGLRGCLWLFDESGRVVAYWTPDDSTDAVTLTIPGPDRVAGAVLFIGVSPAWVGPPGDPSASIPFQLQVAHTANVGPTIGLPIVGTATLAPFTARGSSSASSASIAIVPMTTDDAAPLVNPSPRGGGDLGGNPVAIGPLPHRAAGPSGGWFEDGDPIPPLDRLGEAPSEYDPLSARPRGEEPGPAEGDYPAIVARAPDPALTLLRGPGGFPRLGASAADVHRRAGPDPSAVDLLPALADVEPIALGASADSGLGRTSSPPVDSASSRRTPALLGLNLAGALTFGLLLPDLIAVFQGLTAARPGKTVRARTLGGRRVVIPS